MDAIEFGKKVLKEASEEYVREYDPDRPEGVANIDPRVVSLIEDKIVDMSIDPAFFDLPSGKKAIAQTIRHFFDEKLARAFVAVAEAWVVERHVNDPSSVTPSDDPHSIVCLFAIVYEPDRSFLIRQRVDHGRLVGDQEVNEGIAGGALADQRHVLH